MSWQVEVDPDVAVTATGDGFKVAASLFRNYAFVGPVDLVVTGEQVELIRTRVRAHTTAAVTGNGQHRREGLTR